MRSIWMPKMRWSTGSTWRERWLRGGRRWLPSCSAWHLTAWKLRSTGPLIPQPFDPLRFLNLADELPAESSDDAWLRSAVSRAYYAMYLIARDWVRVTSRHDDHTTVLQELNQRE